MDTQDKENIQKEIHRIKDTQKDNTQNKDTQKDNTKNENTQKITTHWKFLTLQPLYQKKYSSSEN